MRPPVHQNEARSPVGLDCYVRPDPHTISQTDEILVLLNPRPSKEGWALRTETTLHDLTDVQPTKAMDTLPHLYQVGQQINTRLLETEHLAGVAWPEPALLERVQQPRAINSQWVAALVHLDTALRQLTPAKEHLAVPLSPVA